MPNETLPQRTLRTTFWLALFFSLVFGLRGDVRISFGLGLGAAIALFSLWSLIVIVPRLVAPGNPTAGKILLGIAAFLKLPLYAGILQFAMVSPYIEPFAVFIGACFVPAVLVLKVAGYQLVEKVNLPLGEETCRASSSASN